MENKVKIKPIMLVQNVVEGMALKYSQINNRLEILHTEPSNMCVIAAWHKHSEGYELHFIDSRPFIVPGSDFMLLASIGQNILDTLYKQE
jgi:hypothetical protein